MADPRVTDVDKMMSQCSFSSTSYVASATEIVSDIQVEATKPATTGTSGSTATAGASSSTESASSGAGKMAVSLVAGLGVGIALLLRL